jgi:ubiquitin-activating enzyme E1 C
MHCTALPCHYAGVVKNVIPAVASTNAIIAAACVNEAFKLLTYCSQSLNTYMMYMGAQGMYSHTFEYGVREDCVVCGADSEPKPFRISAIDTLTDVIARLKAEPTYQLKNPSLTSQSTSLYMQRPPSLEEATRPNLDKVMSTLVQCGEIITISDNTLNNVTLSVKIMWE